ncbi:MAG: hypothetical protein RBU29_05970 [bacterium]|jgi:hypothetical protein|nr:hypothetical protein [bacterium]
MTDHPTISPASFHNSTALPDRDWPYFSGMLFILLVVGAVVYYPDPFRHVLTGFILAAGMILQGYDLLSYKTRQSKAGEVLMDIGPDIPRRWLLIGLTFIEVAILCILLYRNGLVYFFDSLAFLFAVSITVYTGFQASLCRLCLHEHGLVYGTNFVPWQRIASLEWIDDKGCYLTAHRVKTLFPCAQLLKWPVAPSSKEAISRVIQRRFTELENGTPLETEPAACPE